MQKCKILEPKDVFIFLEEVRAQLVDVDGIPKEVTVEMGGKLVPCLYTEISIVSDMFLANRKDSNVLGRMKALYELVSHEEIGIIGYDPLNDLKSLFEEIYHKIPRGIAGAIGGVQVSCMKRTILEILDGFTATIGTDKNLYWQQQVRNIYGIFNLQQ